MIFGPVLPVELLTSSRRARYFIVRVAYAAVLLLLLWIEYEIFLLPARRPYEITSQRALAAFAGQFFNGFAVVQLLAVLVLTPTMVAGTVAEEKERKTIEYLLVSDLSNGEIVLGKLAARLLHLVSQVAVGLPVLALTMMFGGVSPEGVVAVLVITVSTMVSVAALSIWSSVQARRARDAVTRVFLILGVLMLAGLPNMLPWFPWGLSPVLDYVEPVLGPILDANPFICLDRTISARGIDWSSVWLLVRNQSVVAIPCCVLAVLQVRKAYVRQAIQGAQRLRGWSFGLWKPRLGDSPMIWKEMFAERRGSGLGLMGVAAQSLLFLAALAATIYAFVQTWDGRAGSRQNFGIFITIMGTGVACVGLLIVVIRGAASIASEREGQTWDTLLTSPLDGHDIVRGKLLGSLYAMRGVLLLLGILWGLGVVAGAIPAPLILVLLLELAIFALFGALMGLLYSLKLGTSLRAMAAAAATAVFVGGAYLFLCIPMLERDTEFVLLSCVPFLLGFPVVASTEPNLPREELPRLIGICIAGNLTYLIAAVFLYRVAVDQFDRLSGRLTGRMWI